MNIKIEISGVTPEALSKLTILHRRLMRDDETPVSITTKDSDGSLFVTNDGATGNFIIRPMSLTPEQARVFIIQADELQGE